MFRSFTDGRATDRAAIAALESLGIRAETNNSSSLPLNHLALLLTPERLDRDSCDLYMASRMGDQTQASLALPG